MKLEKVKLSQLIPLEKNVRKHNDKQVDEFVRSLNDNGQTRPFVIDENNNILIGNGMYAAMIKRGDTEAYALRKTGLTEKQKKKLVLSDNKIFSLGTDNYDVIQEYINEIAEDGDYDIAGYDEDIIREMTRTAEEIIDDVMSYGTDTAFTGKEINEMPAPVVAPTPQQNASVNAYNAPQSPAPSAATQDNYVRQEVHNERTIICPCCGEVIHID